MPKKPDIKLKQILDNYIKHKDGAIFQVLEKKDDPNTVFLRTKNKYIKKKLIDLRQGIVDGTWMEVNEHEWKKWVAKDNTHMEELSQKLVKRIVLAQLLLELDEELKQDYEEKKYFRGLLEKSNKEAERITCEQFDKLYSVDKDILQNIMSKVDDITTVLAKAKITDYVQIEVLLKKYFADPEKYQTDKIELTKVG